uniref:Uncharacterized protein n=1 Tax=Brassica oleracea TaxID=3712 RepID=A0A3P6BG36_BRAOL|nr:unnamed protein product [Brassica oleracea]
MFLNEVRENLEINPKVLQDQIQLRYDLNPSNDQCRKEKKKAFDLIQDQTNPCSITDLRTVIGAAGLEVFDRFYTDYKESMKEFEEYDKDVYAAFMARNPETCSRDLFTTPCCCEDALNNNS